MYRMKPSNVSISVWVRVFALTLTVTSVMGWNRSHGRQSYGKSAKPHC